MLSLRRKISDPGLSIIIPALNEESYLPRLLASIGRQDLPGVEVIVVDGRSSDETVKVARSFSKVLDLRVITSNRGTSRQRNRGAKVARYRRLLFLDADMVLPDGCLASIREKIPPGDAWVVFTLHLPTKWNLFDYAFIAVAFGFVWVHSLMRIPLNSGSFVLTTKYVHDGIGGFDERALIGEDVDYLQRAVRAGAKYHLWFRPAVRASPRRLRRDGRIWLLLKWFNVYRHIRKTGKPMYAGHKLGYRFGDFKGGD